MKTLYIDMDNTLVDFRSKLEGVAPSVLKKYEGRVDEIKASAPPKMVEAFKTLWKRRSFRHISVASGLHAFVAYGNQFLPPFFQRVHGFETGELSLWLGLISGVVGGLGGAYRISSSVSLLVDLGLQHVLERRVVGSDFDLANGTYTITLLHGGISLLVDLSPR